MGKSTISMENHNFSGGKLTNIWLMMMVNIWLIVVHNVLLVGGIPTPLKNDGVKVS